MKVAIVTSGHTPCWHDIISPKNMNAQYSTLHICYFKETQWPADAFLWEAVAQVVEWPSWQRKVPTGSLITSSSWTDVKVSLSETVYWNVTSVLYQNT